MDAGEIIRTSRHTDVVRQGLNISGVAMVTLYPVGNEALTGLHSRTRSAAVPVASAVVWIIVLIISPVVIAAGPRDISGVTLIVAVRIVYANYRYAVICAGILHQALLAVSIDSRKAKIDRLLRQGLIAVETTPLCLAARERLQIALGAAYPDLAWAADDNFEGTLAVAATARYSGLDILRLAVPVPIRIPVPVSVSVSVTSAPVVVAVSGAPVAIAIIVATVPGYVCGIAFVAASCVFNADHCDSIIGVWIRRQALAPVSVDTAELEI